MIDLLKDLIPLAVAVVVLTAIWLIMGWPIHEPKPRRCCDCEYEKIKHFPCWGLRNIKEDDINTLNEIETLAVVCKTYQRKRLRWWAPK